MANSSVSSSTTSAQLLAANAQRGAFVIENSDANRLYVLVNSGTASSTNYSFSLAQNENALVPGYTGQVMGIWAGDGAGAALITEY
jgi:hypothetical protein